MKRRDVESPLFSVPISIFVGGNHEAVNKALKTEAFVVPNRRGGVAFHDDGHVILYVVKRNDLKTMCHESVHAANFVLKFAGVEVDTSNDETLAYLTEWIFGQLLEVR